MSRRDALLACLDELIAGCRAAAPGPWHVAEAVGINHYWVVGTPPRAPLADWCSAPDATFIAQHGPDRMEALYVGLRAEVERHTDEVPNSGPGFLPAVFCKPCDHVFRDVACPFVVRWASRLGVGDGTETGDGERGTPAGHGDTEGARTSSGPAAVASVCAFEFAKGTCGEPPSAVIHDPAFDGPRLAADAEWLVPVREALRVLDDYARSGQACHVGPLAARNALDSLRPAIAAALTGGGAP